MDDDVRIGDAERERVAERLNAHVGAGRLDLAELERRIDAVYAARTRGELATVLADLPEPVRAPRPGPRPPLVPAVEWGPWLGTAVICLVIWAATSLGSGHPLYFWPMWVIGPWGALLALGAVTGAPHRCHRAIAPRS